MAHTESPPAAEGVAVGLVVLAVCVTLCWWVHRRWSLMDKESEAAAKTQQVVPGLPPCLASSAPALTRCSLSTTDDSPSHHGCTGNCVAFLLGYSSATKAPLAPTRQAISKRQYTNKRPLSRLLTSSVRFDGGGFVCWVTTTTRPVVTSAVRAGGWGAFCGG